MINKKKNIVIFAILSILLILVVALLTFSKSWLSKSTGFKISNEEQYFKNVRQTDKDALLTVLANQVKNVSAIDTEKTLVEGSIREGSYTEDAQGGVVVSSFLLDIDAISQTYTVEFPWSKAADVPDGITVECPRNDQSKYPDSFCTGIYTTSASIEIYLPYEGATNGNEYSVYTNYMTENGLDLFVIACGDENLMDATKKDFENWINQTKFLENIYNINVVDTCTQFN